MRVIGACKTGYASDVADAIVWASGGTIDGIPSIETPARVVSMSLTGEGACPSFLQSAVNQALASGTVLIAASGNAGGNSEDYFPANCAGVVAVAASTRAGGLAAYSNLGANVGLAAPGGDATGAIFALTASQVRFVLAYLLIYALLYTDAIP